MSIQLFGLICLILLGTSVFLQVVLMIAKEWGR